MRIKDALQLPIMRETKLVAGHKGVKNNIKWVTVVEVLEDIERIDEGEFLITTGFNLMKDEERLKSFHQLLRSRPVAGVAIYTSFYMSKIPDSFVQAANKNNLPLIEIPVDINFSEITRAILEQLVNRQAKRLAHSERIHNELTTLILNDQSLQEVTKRLAQLTSSYIAIYNEFYKPIYTYNNIDTNENSTDSHEKLNTKQLKKSLLKSLRQESKQNFQDDSFTFTIYPIIAKQEAFGWIMMCKLSDDWVELDDVAIERAATIYAMEFLKSQAIEETQLRVQSSLLDDLFNKNYENSQTVIDQAAKLNYDLTKRQCVFHLTFKDKEKIDVQLINRLYKLVEQLLKQRNKQHIIQTKLQSVIFLTDVHDLSPKERKKQMVKLAENILEEWIYFFPHAPLFIGIGKDYSNIDELRKSAREARYATILYKLVNKEANIIHYSELGMYDLLLSMHRRGIHLKCIYQPWIEQLIQESSREIDLIETLYVYLEHNQSIQNAAKQLYVHRHTLRYRLKQIEKRTGLSLQSSDDLLKLQLGIMAYKLSHFTDHFNYQE